MHHPRHRGPAAAERDTVPGAAERIPLDLVGEREAVDRVVMVTTLCGIAGRLGEAVVKGTETTTGDMRDQAVKGPPPLLVLVQSPVEYLAQKAAALRDTKTVGAGDCARERVPLPLAMLQRRDQVADTSKAEAFLRSIGLAKCCLLNFCPSSFTTIGMCA